METNQHDSDGDSLHHSPVYKKTENDVNKTLNRIIDDFVDFYKQFNANQQGKEHSDVVARINAGDCGTASIAIGWVWNHLSGDEVIYHDNFDHGYIEVNGRYYDTFMPYGCDDHTLMYGYKKENCPKATKGDILLQHYRFLMVDDYGVSMVREYARQYKIPLYPYFTNLEVGGIPLKELHLSISKMESILNRIKDKDCEFAKTLKKYRDDALLWISATATKK